MIMRSRKKQGRPFLVTLLAVLVLSIAVIHLIRFIEALQAWTFLSNLPGISPIYLAVSGLIWALVGLPLSLGLWLGWLIAPSATRVIALVFMLYSWLERILLANAAGERTNWLFVAIVTLILLALTYWALSRPNAKAYFGELHEQSF